MVTSALVIYILLGVIVILAFWLIFLEWRLMKVFRGKSANNLETVMADLGLALDELLKKQEHNEVLFENIYSRLKTTLQKTHTVRFNPFKDQGGNHSFATAIMDETGNGVILSGLYSRDKVNVYAKPLVKYNSTYELSTEEKQAITTAKSNL